MHSTHRTRSVLAGAALLLVCAAGHAQQPEAPTGPADRMSATSDYGRDSWSLLPGTRRGYVGLNVGRPDYKLGDGTGLYDNDDPDTRLHLYTGGLVNDWLGAEVGYLNEGKAERGGGTTRAQGLNLSLVLRAPIGQFNVFGKVGATYGRTRVSADALSGIDEGRDSGWGRSLGAGVGFDFTPNVGVVLEWSRHRFHFAGDVRDDVDATSVGLLYRF
jgi:OOP family OmpA-OmpF porin